MPQALHCTNIVHPLLHHFAARFTGLISYLSCFQLYKITHSMTGTISFSRGSWYKEFTKPKMSKEYTVQLQNSILGGEGWTSDNVRETETNAHSYKIYRKLSCSKSVSSKPEGGS